MNAQIDCLPLHGSVIQSHKGKGKIGFNGKLYIPTTKGLIIYNGSSVEVLNAGTSYGELNNDALRQIHFASDSTVWITYSDGGYSIISKDTIQHFINTGGPSDFLCFDVEEFDNTLFMGTKNGYYPYVDGKFQDPLNLSLIASQYPEFEDIDNDIRNAVRSKSNPNKLWLYGIGLFSYDLISNEFEFYKLPKRFLEDFGGLKIRNNGYLIADLFETENAIYQTTWGGGILEMSKRNKTWKKHLISEYEDEAPLNENILFEMEALSDSSFFVGTAWDGVYTFDYKHKTFKKFNPDGNKELFKNETVRLAKFQNNIVFKGYQNVCIASVNSQDENKSSIKEMLNLRDVKIDGISQNIGNYFFKTFENTFKSYQRNITIEYEFVSLFRTQHREYEYQLKGHKNKWIKQGDVSLVNFSDLRGGTYSFSVRHLDQNGAYVYSKPYQFSIQKFYYEHWWFWLSILSSIALIIATFIYNKWNQKKKELALKDKHSRELAQLEMSALRAQMNPHFLFNSLNSIKNFALTKGPKETASYLTKFSHLIRLILQNSKSPMVNLKDELDALKLYIEIESLRFENKFKFKFNVDDGLLISSVQIPPLILQPFVENSIWHGLMHKRDGEGTLIISVKDLGNKIQCTIEDNGIGREMAQKLKKEKVYGKQKSLGMDITSNRIELTNKIYNINTEFQIIDLYDQQGNPSGTRVLVDIPKT